MTKTKTDETVYVVTTREEIRDACCRIMCTMCPADLECTQKNRGFCKTASLGALNEIDKMKFRAKSAKITKALVVE